MKIVILMFALLVLPSLAVADCPQSAIWWGCFDGVGNVSSNGSLSWGTESSWSVGEPCPYGCYNLPAGILTLSASESCFGLIHAGDEYWIVGGDEQTVYHFYADLHVTGNLIGAGAIGGGIKDYGPYNSHIDQVETTPTVDFHRTYALDHRSGEHFRLWSAISIEASNSEITATALGSLRFGGLPEGAYVVSCQAYDVPVPAGIVTWGRVRATYR